MGDFSRRLPLALTSSRPRFSSPLTIIAAGLGMYVVFAIGYYHFVAPAINTAVPHGVVTHWVARTAPPQQPSSKSLRFVATGVAAAPNSAESSATGSHGSIQRAPSIAANDLAFIEGRSSFMAVQRLPSMVLIRLEGAASKGHSPACRDTHADP
jgi:hypothetical protein